MLKFRDEKIFNANDIKEFTVPPKPAEPDKRGFIYIVLDSVFPDEFKIGVTINMQKRLMQYNSDKPRKTAQLHYISTMFDDAKLVEDKILEALYEKTPPTTLSKEWFPMEFLEQAIYLVEQAEKEFNHAEG